MKEKPFGFRIAVALAFVAAMIALLGFARQGDDRLVVPFLALKTTEERRATLEALRTAWNNRPAAATPANARAEKDFINRTANFVDRSAGREIEGEAFAFYRRTVFDFFARYQSEEILGQR